MAKVAVTREYLEDIADSIRTRGGFSSQYKPSQMASAIENIPRDSDHSAEDAIIDRTISGAYENSMVTNIGSHAFAYCSRLTAASFPACTSIGSSAFQYCYSLTTASFHACTSIGNYAFAYCSSLTTMSFPACTSIGSSAFQYCYSLTTASFHACTSIGNYAFAYCSSLTTMSFPACTSIGNYAFSYCTNLTTASFPACTSIGSCVFAYCSSLATASFPACKSIGGSAFSKCCTFISLYLLGSSVARLANSNAFSSTPFMGYVSSTSGVWGSIYVPASLLDSYKTATNWAYYSLRFVGVE